ncbi:hypothetical protein Cgig2_017261 [Carnegiea gigantea]|uniref:Ubiquitin-like protease family profile domain-containing protein n=1 Tax=Carnegiea gigantea TaxID=171969 RepID=A0A9Q1GWY2_9CARY|nr:hypothetical protein Cgig2_017261 [Carnegiea gigantea]
MENSTHNMRKVQVFGTVLEDKGASVACKGNCEQRNSLETQNSDTLKMLNVNVKRRMKHVVDNETTKSNKHVTDICATTYIAHPSKSSEKKESPMQFRKRRIIVEHNFSKDGMRTTNEFTRSISVGGLNFLHKEDKKVNVNKVYIPMNDRAIHWFLIIVDLQRRRVALLDSLPLTKSNDFRSNDYGMHVLKYMEAEFGYDWSLIYKDMEVQRLRKIVELQMSIDNDIKKIDEAAENCTVNTTVVETLWDKNVNLSEDNSLWRTP